MTKNERKRLEHVACVQYNYGSAFGLVMNTFRRCLSQAPARIADADSTDSNYEY
jgi:hypothetical protein